MQMHIVAAGRGTVEFSELVKNVSQKAGHEAEVCGSLAQLRSSIGQHLCDLLILDLDGFVEPLDEVKNFLTELTQSGRVHRLLVVCDGSFPVALSDRFDLLQACHVALPLSPTALDALLSGDRGSIQPGDYPERVTRTISGGEVQFTTRMPELFPVLDQLNRIAPHDVTILLVGETGTGKTHLAQVAHGLSRRSGERFLATPCGALPKDLIESELFGHVRGAFTGADRNKLGRFEAAGKGTLLLDEIDVLSPKEQSKLLQVIETGEFQPVGASESRMSMARLIAAANVDLKHLVNAGKFRSDLYYRLSVLEFRLPPLRQRRHDLLPLAIQFIKEASETHGVEVKRIEAGFIQALFDYQWPGNVRELRNQMRRVVLFALGGVLTQETLSPAVLGLEEAVSVSDVSGNSTRQSQQSAAGPVNAAVPSAPPEDSPKGADWEIGSHLYESEKQFLVAALDAHSNNRSATARALGISRVGLYKKLRRLGLHVALRDA